MCLTGLQQKVTSNKQWLFDLSHTTRSQSVLADQTHVLFIKCISSHCLQLNFNWIRGTNIKHIVSAKPSFSNQQVAQKKKIENILFFLLKHGSRYFNFSIGSLP